MEQTRKKVTLRTLLTMKESKIPASFITAYDYPSAVFANQAGIDMLLVGDSGGMTMLGYKNTMPVTMDEMMHFTKAVCRGNDYAFVVGDMPFMSYQPSAKDAIYNAGEFMMAGCDAVKIEINCLRSAVRIYNISEAGIPVMAHLGLTPQSMAKQGGYRVHGKSVEELRTLACYAEEVERAGASLILLEAVPEECADLVRKAVTIPVYGIGAGSKVDGQLLIWHDVLGTFVGDVKPKFAKQYLSGGCMMIAALQHYNHDVKMGKFPSEENNYPVDPVELEKIIHAFK